MENAKMFLGEYTGRRDTNGDEIKCGDKVEYTEWREAYTETTTEDGWGRTIQLCNHEQYKVPRKEKTLIGIVKYSAKGTGFIVQFYHYMLNSGKKSEDLYMLLYGRTSKLVVIEA